MSCHPHFPLAAKRRTIHFRDVNQAAIAEETTTRRTRRTVVLGTTVLVLAVAIRRPTCIPGTHQEFTDKDTVVLADFANTTGDPVFGPNSRRHRWLFSASRLTRSGSLCRFRSPPFAFGHCGSEAGSQPVSQAPKPHTGKRGRHCG